MVLDKLRELLLFYSYFYIRFIRSDEKAKLWKIIGVVILCKMIRAYVYNI